MKKILVTGAAGFIGFHTVRKLIKQREVEVVGIDNINSYYDVELKFDRLSACGINVNENTKDNYIVSSEYQNYKFKKLDVSDSVVLKTLFEEEKFDFVIHLAAQAGVRYSLINPDSYVQSNLVGFANILECCRHNNIKHLVYASSSSVYGLSNDVPFSETDNVDYPVSFYAATKKSNELMAHSYSHLYKLPTTGLRLFTVYGPWGRPDMAPMLFAKAIYDGSPINIFNNGDMLRDFTFVDDIVEGVVRVVDAIPTDKEIHPFYRILNVGNSKPIQLLDFVKTLESAIGKKAELMMQPMQPGDVKITYADTSDLEKCVHYKPTVSIKSGVSAFVDWYKAYNKISD